MLENNSAILGGVVVKYEKSQLPMYTHPHLSPGNFHMAAKAPPRAANSESWGEAQASAF